MDGKQSIFLHNMEFDLSLHTGDVHGRFKYKNTLFWN